MHDFSHPSVVNDVRAAGDGRPGPSRHASAANIVAKLPYFDRAVCWRRLYGIYPLSASD